MIDFLIDIKRDNSNHREYDLFRVKPQSLKKFSRDGQIFYLWGDPILNGEITLYEDDEGQIAELLNNVSGHYYFVLQKNDGCYIGNSLFSMLPVYYHVSGTLIISNNVLDIKKIIENGEVNKRFFLENILFNYPLFDISYFSDIALLPANSYIKFKNGVLNTVKHTRLEEYFTSSPRHWKKSVSDISDLFIDTSKKYFPDEPSSYALTGGFDGRTLVACSLFHGNNFDAFCFGSDDSEDIVIGKYVADKVGLNYSQFELDETYVKKHSKSCGIEFVKNASGSATCARAHYLYAAKELAEKYRYVVTGNFGNEVLQTTNVVGVVTSPNVYNLFASDTYDEAVRRIRNSPEYTWLNMDNLKWEWESLLEDIKILPSFDNTYSGLTKTQKYYITFYEEVMRKYFGAELTNQFKYIINRTPYLDIRFFKEIVKTELAGANREFFIRNPLKRYKGQIIYGHIIKNTSPLLGRIRSSWGYKPDDLVTYSGKLKIVYGYLKRNRKVLLPGIANSTGRFERRNLSSNHLPDPFGVNSAFRYNIPYFKSLDINREIFNYDMVIKYLDQKRVSRQVFNAMSQIYWQNYISQVLA
jgi:hypothetical protein